MARGEAAAQSWRVLVGAALSLLITVIVAAAVGAMIGLQPMIVVPLIIPIITLIVLWLGVRSGRRALGREARWYPYVALVLWVLTVNLPALVAFDQTGFTREHGLFNPQSIGRIAVFLAASAMCASFWVLWGRDRALRQAGRPVAGAALLFSLYLWYLLQAPLVTAGMELALAVFRISEWLVAFALMYMAFTIQNARGQFEVADRLRLLVPMLFFLVGSVAVLALIAPERAFQRSSITGTARLGGLFTHPNLLAIVAVVLLAYTIGYWRGWKRVASTIACLLVLALTYSRGGYVAFLLVSVAGVLLFAKHAGVRVAALVTIGIAALSFYQSPDLADGASRILSRGNQPQSLATLSERTAVWEAAKALISNSPWLGEGFISGPKLLGNEMIRSRLSHNFAAMHAHNELLQAQISGGVIATLLSLAIHLRILYLLVRIRLAAREAFVLWSIVLSVIAWGALTPSLSYLLTVPGVMLGWLLLTLEGLVGKIDSTKV